MGSRITGSPEQKPRTVTKNGGKIPKERMKAMENYKKILAVLLTLVMVLGMSITSTAANQNADGTTSIPTANDTKEVTVSGLQKGARVTAYQIIKGKYDENAGFTGYEWAKEFDDTHKGDIAVTQADGTDVVTGLTSTFIAGIAKNDKNQLADLTTVPAADASYVIADTNGNAILTLNAGTWLILVTAPETDATKTYNPMIASVYYRLNTDKNGTELDGSGVDGSKKWTLETTGAWAKTSDITVEKTAKNAAGSIAKDTAEVGSTVTFEIASTIPSYSDAYKEGPTYVVTDKITNGLKYNSENNPTVKVGSNEVQASADGKTNYTVTYYRVYDATTQTPITSEQTKDDAVAFTITFDSAYLKSLANSENRALTVTYTAKVTETAITGVANNHAEVKYSTSSSTSETSTVETDEKVYTFEFNGVVKKIDESDEALGGAEFTLYRKNEDGTIGESFGVATSSSYTANKGKLVFQGVDGATNGSIRYYLKETKAPDNYSINDTIYEIWVSDIDTTANPDSPTYTVKVKVKGTEDNTAAPFTSITYGQAYSGENSVTVKDTKLSTLPSTGGIGTTIFTIGGCAIMIAAAFLFFASRKKKEEK